MNIFTKRLALALLILGLVSISIRPVYAVSEYEWKQALWKTTLDRKTKMTLDELYKQYTEDIREEMYQTFLRDIRAQKDIVKEGATKFLRGDFNR